MRRQFLSTHLAPILVVLATMGTVHAAPPRDAELHHMLVTRVDVQHQATGVVAMGWNIRVSGDHEIAWKNGSVGGYRAFIGVDAKARIGVVALANAQTAGGVDDIGLHVLDPSYAVDLHVPVAHKAIALESALLDRYVGRYKFSDSDILTVTRDGAQLYGHSPGADKYPLYPEAEREFFLKVIDAKVTFVVPENGRARASAAIWHQGGQDQRGERIE